MQYIVPYTGKDILQFMKHKKMRTNILTIGLIMIFILQSYVQNNTSSFIMVSFSGIETKLNISRILLCCRVFFSQSFDFISLNFLNFQNRWELTKGWKTLFCLFFMQMQLVSEKQKRNLYLNLRIVTVYKTSVYEILHTIE